MTCPTCGFILANGITYCPGCGTYLPDNVAKPVSQNAETIVGNATPSQSPTAPHTPYTERVSNSSTPYVQSSQGYSPQQTSYPAPSPYANGYPTQPVYPGYPTAPNYPNYTAPYAPIPPTSTHTKRGLSRGMTALLIVVALCMMFGGFGLIYYTTVAHPAQLHAQATATVQTILTNNAHSTATANAQATGTTVAYANATATANTQATAQAVSTATALQNIYTTATAGTPALSSSLAFQDGANWDVYNTTDGGGCGYSGGTLHASVFKAGYYVPCFAHATNYTNFAYQVQMTILAGDEGGLIFRASDAASKFYFFRIGRDGVYSLYVSKDSTHSLPLVEDNSSAIKTALGQTNVLTVVARGNALYLYINKQFVGSASDSSYSAGEIGIFAGDNKVGTNVAFSNARVWSL